MKKLITVCAVIVLFGKGYAMAGTWTTIDAPNSTYTQIYGIDGSKVVGYSEGLNVGYFLYDRTTWTYLPNKPGSFATQPEDISGNNIAGAYYVLPSSKYGYVYDGTTWTTYDVPWVTGTTGINGIDGSNIVGAYFDAAHYSHGFLYNGTWTKLDFPGAKFTSVNGISDGNLVGGYGQQSGLGHGFLYNVTRWTTLDFPGAVWTEIQDIDGSNIVGDYYNVSGPVHGFLYDGTTWTTLDFPGTQGTYITGISGNTLAGWYSNNPDGSSPHGFLYTIPEPATVLLLGFGAVMLRRRGITIYNLLFTID